MKEIMHTLALQLFAVVDAFYKHCVSSEILQVQLEIQSNKILEAETLKKVYQGFVLVVKKTEVSEKINLIKNTNRKETFFKECSFLVVPFLVSI